MSRSLKLLLAAMLIAFTSVPGRADTPATQPTPATAPPETPKADAAATPPAADDQDFVISPMRVQEFKGITFLCTTSQTTLGGIGDQVRQGLEKLKPLIAAGTVKPSGPPLLIFHGVNGDPNTQFPLDVGIPVARDAKAPDGFAVKQLDKFRCATVLYSGSNQQIRHAYEAVYNDLQGAGLEPTDEGREALLFFEGPDSVNNVALIAVGVR